MKSVIIDNQRGQSLIEYLILVSIVAIGSIGIVSIVGQNINIKFANVAKGLGSTASEADLPAAKINAGMYRRRTMGDFLQRDDSTVRKTAEHKTGNNDD